MILRNFQIIDCWSNEINFAGSLSSADLRLELFFLQSKIDLKANKFLNIQQLIDSIGLSENEITMERKKSCKSRNSQPLIMLMSDYVEMKMRFSHLYWMLCLF